jgi:hypothetical protein
LKVEGIVEKARIDGDHSFTSVTSAVEMYEPLVKTRGTITFHYPAA